MEHWFEIFSTGTHTDSNGLSREWSGEDLDRIIGQYDTATYEAPIVIGHPDSTAPAFGWIEALKRDGGKLLAKAKQLLPQFVDWVNEGRYKKISIALNGNDELRHVGFLGAAPPAVKGLAAISFQSNDELFNYEMTNGDTPIEEVRADSDDKFGKEENNEEQNDRETESNSADDQPIEQKIAQEAAVANPPNEIASFSLMMNDLIYQGRLTPAQKTSAERVLNALFPPAANQEFSSQPDIDKHTKEALQCFRQFLALMPAQILFGEQYTKSSRKHPPIVDSDRAGDIIRDQMKNYNPHQ